MARFNVDADSNLSSYNAIWDLTKQMLEAAQNGEWEKVAAHEQARNGLATELAARNSQNPVRPTEAEAEVIRKIMAYDQRIKMLAEVRLTELKAVLDSVGNERKLFKAYNQI